MYCGVWYRTLTTSNGWPTINPVAPIRTGKQMTAPLSLYWQELCYLPAMIPAVKSTAGDMFPTDAEVSHCTINLGGGSQSSLTITIDIPFTVPFPTACRDATTTGRVARQGPLGWPVISVAHMASYRCYLFSLNATEADIWRQSSSDVSRMVYSLLLFDRKRPTILLNTPTYPYGDSCFRADQRICGSATRRTAFASVVSFWRVWFGWQPVGIFHQNL